MSTTTTETLSPRLVPCQGASILARARQHIGEQYVFGAQATFAPDYAGPWDCAEFISWCIYHATGGITYGCRPTDDGKLNAYTGFFAEDVRRKGIAISVDEASRLPGAIVLRKPAVERTGHIVLCVGDERSTIEAHSRRRGVIEHTLIGRRWDTGILVPGVAYARAERVVESETSPRVYQLTEPMMQGETVSAIQRTLYREGFYHGDLHGLVDGIYGPQTAEAVRKFQVNAGLVVDGEVGPETARALGVVL